MADFLPLIFGPSAPNTVSQRCFFGHVWTQTPVDIVSEFQNVFGAVFLESHKSQNLRMFLCPAKSVVWFTVKVTPFTASQDVDAAGRWKPLGDRVMDGPKLILGTEFVWPRWGPCLAMATGKATYKNGHGEKLSKSNHHYTIMDVCFVALESSRVYKGGQFH